MVPGYTRVPGRCRGPGILGNECPAVARNMGAKGLHKARLHLCSRRQRLQIRMHFAITSQRAPWPHRWGGRTCPGRNKCDYTKAAVAEHATRRWQSACGCDLLLRGIGCRLRGRCSHDGCRLRKLERSCKKFELAIRVSQRDLGRTRARHGPPGLPTGSGTPGNRATGPIEIQAFLGSGGPVIPLPFKNNPILYTTIHNIVMFALPPIEGPKHPTLEGPPPLESFPSPSKTTRFLPT
jgi:hypothetical protein